MSFDQTTLTPRGSTTELEPEGTSQASPRRNRTIGFLLSALFVPPRSCRRFFCRRGTKSAEGKGSGAFVAACEQLGLLQSGETQSRRSRRNSALQLSKLFAGCEESAEAAARGRSPPAAAPLAVGRRVQPGIPPHAEPLRPGTGRAPLRLRLRRAVISAPLR